MVTVYITRYALESDPLEVIADARKQALAEREAQRIGLQTEYRHCDDFVKLHVTGEADQKIRDFLAALKGFGITGCTVDVHTREEETQLGDAADAFEVCVLNQSILFQTE
jgi:hypothetical protein